MIAPVTYIPRFLTGQEADSFFLNFWSHLPWEQRDGAPRRECWFNPYGMPYTYGSGEHARTYEGRSFEVTAYARALAGIMRYLNAETDASYDCCFVNGYEHGRQHLGWHADDSPEMDMDHPIATVSLGAPREIWFRRKGDSSGSRVDKLLLGNGSAAIMAAGMQRDWQHRIPKSDKADCGPRISLTCRKLVR